MKAEINETKRKGAEAEEKLLAGSLGNTTERNGRNIVPNCPEK